MTLPQDVLEGMETGKGKEESVLSRRESFLNDLHMTSFTDLVKRPSPAGDQGDLVCDGLHGLPEKQVYSRQEVLEAREAVRAMMIAGASPLSLRWQVNPAQRKQNLLCQATKERACPLLLPKWNRYYN